MLFIATYLTGDLRKLRPDVFISITTGTWPSPYWLWYGDSVWRNGHDWNAHGAGSVRQQWITYRDMTTRKMIADRAPLYPLNSLMIVAVCYARLGTATRMTDDTDDLIDEIRMAFGGGTQTLELYVTPKMLEPRAWDALAEAANWARKNGDVLVDSHFVGGDPGEGQPYGYASWSPRKGILVLRNPGETPASLTLDLAEAFELPANAPRNYRLASPWKEDRGRPQLPLRAGQRHEFKLEPFQTIVLEATPTDAANQQSNDLSIHIKVLADSTTSPKARCSAAHALGKLGSDAADTVPVLTDALKDEDRRVRLAAAAALGNIGPAAKDSLLMLLDEAVHKQDDDFRVTAMRAVWKIDPEGSAQVEALMKLVQERLKEGNQ